MSSEKTNINRIKNKKCSKEPETQIDVVNLRIKASKKKPEAGENELVALILHINSGRHHIQTDERLRNSGVDLME